nr:PqqD family protein [Nocardioides luti]
MRHPEQPPFLLEGTAALVWRGVNGHRSVGEIVASLAAEFDVAREQVAADIGPFLEDLQRRHLISQAELEGLHGQA